MKHMFAFHLQAHYLWHGALTWYTPSVWKVISSYPPLPCKAAGEVFCYLLLVCIEQYVMLQD